MQRSKYLLGSSLVLLLSSTADALVQPNHRSSALRHCGASSWTTQTTTAAAAARAVLPRRQQRLPAAPLRCSLEAAQGAEQAAAGFVSSLLAQDAGGALDWGSSMLTAVTAADYEFQGSYASLYVTLFLFVISFPGIISLVTRATKVSLAQRTYVLPGPAVEEAKPLRQVAAEIMAYFQANNYKVAEAGETIVFKGAIDKSKSQAFFLSACMFGGLGTLALVLSIGIPRIGPFEIEKLWYLLVLPSPYAGWYYWQNAQVDGEIRVRLLTTDDEEATEVTVQAGKEQLDQFAAVMDYNEKGKIRVRGILEKNPEEFVA